MFLRVYWMFWKISGYFRNSIWSACEMNLRIPGSSPSAHAQFCVGDKEKHMLHTQCWLYTLILKILLLWGNDHLQGLMVSGPGKICCLASRLKCPRGWKAHCPFLRLNSFGENVLSWQLYLCLWSQCSFFLSTGDRVLLSIFSNFLWLFPANTETKK